MNGVCSICGQAAIRSDTGIFYHGITPEDGHTANPLRKWAITKRLETLGGIIVTDILTQDAVFSRPFHDGQAVFGLGGWYTIITCEKVP